jgi:hypothetical protein
VLELRMLGSPKAAPNGQAAAPVEASDEQPTADADPDEYPF